MSKSSNNKIIKPSGCTDSGQSYKLSTSKVFILTQFFDKPQVLSESNRSLLTLTILLKLGASPKFCQMHKNLPKTLKIEKIDYRRNVRK